MIRYACGKLSDMLKGSSVAICGSAPSIQDNRDGYIDKHDIVVRMNNFKLLRSCGEKKHIYYSYFGKAIRKNASEINEFEVVMCKYPEVDFTGHTYGETDAGYSENFIKFYENKKSFFNKIFVPVWKPRLSEWTQNFLSIGRIPSTGLSCILDILRFKPKKIYITGFDFFSTMMHNVNEPITQKELSRHDFEREKEFFEKIVRYEPVELDKHLKKIFGDTIK